MPRVRIVTVLLLSLCAALPLVAGEPKSDESAIGGGFEWMVIPCSNWNCAVAELVLADGNSSVLALPMSAGDHPWIVLRRVRAGSFVVPDDAPVKVDCFDTLALAASRYDGLSQNGPMLLTAPDGKKLVIYVTQTQPKRRSVGR